MALRPSLPTDYRVCWPLKCSRQILGDRKTVPGGPTATPSGSETLCGVEPFPGNKTRFAPRSTQTPRVQASAATRQHTHWQVEFGRRSFPSRKLYAKRQSRGLPQRREMLSDSLQRPVHPGIAWEHKQRYLCCVSEVSRGLKGMDWHRVPGELPFQVSFCQRLHMLTNKSLRRKKG